jgi:Flp pilus assembly protein TadG
MKNRKGVSIVEFSLAGIPALFVIISTIEMSLAMWQYHTLGYAMKEATRAATSHGQGCYMSGVTTGNMCAATIGTLSTQIVTNAIGIPASELNVTFTSASGTVVTCAPVASCLSSNVAWPPISNDDNWQGKSISTSASFPVHAALAMFWPGTHGATFQAFSLGSSSTQQIMF